MSGPTVKRKIRRRRGCLRVGDSTVTKDPLEARDCLARCSSARTGIKRDNLAHRGGIWRNHQRRHRRSDNHRMGDNHTLSGHVGMLFAGRVIGVGHRNCSIECARCLVDVGRLPIESTIGMVGGSFCVCAAVLECPGVRRDVVPARDGGRTGIKRHDIAHLGAGWCDRELGLEGRIGEVGRCRRTGGDPGRSHRQRSTSELRIDVPIGDHAAIRTINDVPICDSRWAGDWDTVGTADVEVDGLAGLEVRARIGVIESGEHGHAPRRIIRGVRLDHG